VAYVERTDDEITTAFEKFVATHPNPDHGLMQSYTLREALGHMKRRDGEGRYLLQLSRDLGLMTEEDSLEQLCYDTTEAHIQSATKQILAICQNSGLSPKEIRERGDGGSCRDHDSARAAEVDLILDALPQSEREPAIEAAEQAWASYSRK
jgi:hypothetical protein